MERIYCHVVCPLWTVRHPDMASGWLTQYVRHHGYRVHMVDLNAELHRREARPLVLDCWSRSFVSMDPHTFCRAIMEAHEPFLRERLGRIVDEGCRVFGLLLLDGNARMAARISRLIKELAPDAHVVVGGPGSTSLYRLRRRYGDSAPVVHPVENELVEGHAFDSWVLGEGELTLLELLDRLGAGASLAGVRGLALTADGPLAPFKERALIKDLDQLPHATFEGFDLGLYAYRALPFQLSRGCAYARCSHCGLRGYSRGFRVRSPAHAIDEIRHHIEVHGITEFHFSDMGVNGDLERLEAFCDELLRLELGIRWQSFFEIRNDMTPELLRKVVASGCGRLNYGFESGSDRVLGLMRKAYTAAEAADVLRMTRQAGGQTLINVMVGHPGETEEDLEQTLDFFIENAENISMVASVAGTGVHMHSPLLDEREAFGVELEPGGGWRSSDGLIDARVRNERVSRVTEHLRLHGIPCFEAFWEAEPSAARPEAPTAELSGPGERGVEITQIIVSGPHGEDGTCCVDLPLIVNVGYRSRGVERAVFDLEITDVWGRPAFSTPQATRSVRVVDLHPEGWVRMVLGRYDLMPGCYLVSASAAGVPPDPPWRWDHHLLRAPLELMGAPRDQLPVMTPYAWTSHQGRLSDPRRAPLRQLRVQGRAGRERIYLEPGEPLAVRALFEGSTSDEAEIRCVVRDGAGEVVLRGPSPTISLADGEATWTWLVEEPGLAAGSYTLELELQTAGGRSVTAQGLLQVRGEDAAIAGWAALPPAEVRWSPRPGEAGEAPAAEGAALREATLERPDEGPGGEVLLRLLVYVAGDQPHPLRVGVRIVDGAQRTVALRVDRVEAGGEPGWGELELRLRPSLLEGSYQLLTGLWDPEQEDLAEPRWTFPLRISGGSRRDGGGLVFAPHRLHLLTPG